MTSYLTLAAMLTFVLFPLLIPISVEAVHAVRHWRPTWTSARIADRTGRISLPRFAT